MANRNRKRAATPEVVESVEKEPYENVRAYIAAARAKVYTVANKEMVAAYWNGSIPWVPAKELKAAKWYDAL